MQVSIDPYPTQGPSKNTRRFTSFLFILCLDWTFKSNNWTWKAYSLVFLIRRGPSVTSELAIFITIIKLDCVKKIKKINKQTNKFLTSINEEKTKKKQIMNPRNILFDPRELTKICSANLENPHTVTVTPDREDFSMLLVTPSHKGLSWNPTKQNKRIKEKNKTKKKRNSTIGIKLKILKFLNSRDW